MDAAARPAEKPTPAEYWRHLFAHWPEAIPKKGRVICDFGEAIEFNNFLVSGGVLLLERPRPDTTGARKVLVSYAAISGVKLEDPGELARYRVMGFQPPA